MRLGTCRVCGISDEGHPGSGIFTGSFHPYQRTTLLDVISEWLRDAR